MPKFTVTYHLSGGTTVEREAEGESPASVYETVSTELHNLGAQHGSRITIVGQGPAFVAALRVSEVQAVTVKKRASQAVVVG